MCGVIGIFNKKDCFSDIIKGLKVMENRGKDGMGIFINGKIQYGKFNKTNSDNAMGHLLHSVVEHVPQPIKKNGVIVSNCEIYNWRELREKYSLKSKNDSELIIDLIEKKGMSTIDEFDGPYAFAYWLNDKVCVIRDILGIKPIWFSMGGGFYFASEKKALVAIGCENIEELNPRTILVYDIRRKKLNKEKRDFFKISGLRDNEEKILVNTKKLLLKAIEKRIPDRKFGILFSGGIDSTFIAYICKKLGKEFTCYTSALEGSNAPDLVYAKKVAKELGFRLKIKEASLEETRKYIEKIVPLIEDSNVVKVGVALPFFIACEEAKKDNVKVIFSGLGSEEIFAGYERHKKSSDVNKECLSGLLKIYERDLYRDDVITMQNNIELRLPFLDTSLIKYALNIPAEMKLDENRNKIILREVAKKIGIHLDIAERKKRAAQYGSKFDKAIEKLARKEGFKSKSAFLAQFMPSIMKLGALWSSGKDSAYAVWLMKKQNYDIACLISIKSSNPSSYMFHTPNVDLVKLQAQAIGVPLILKETKGEKEKELEDLKKAMYEAKTKHKIDGIVTGALFSDYQRERIERICDELELKIFSPLWHISQENEMRALLKEGFSFIFSSIAALGFDETWLGKIITEKDIDKLVQLNKKYSINTAGEGGEYESFVLNCPLFKKKIVIKETQKIMENQFTGCYNIIRAELG